MGSNRVAEARTDELKLCNWRTDLAGFILHHNNIRDEYRRISLIASSDVLVPVYETESPRENTHTHTHTGRTCTTEGGMITPQQKGSNIPTCPSSNHTGKEGRP